MASIVVLYLTLFIVCQLVWTGSSAYLHGGSNICLKGIFPMAILIRNEQDMVSLINFALSETRTSDCEMIVVPMVIPDTIEGAKTLLLDVKTFDPRIASDILPKDAIGKVSISTDRTVHDALDELESLTMVGAHEMLMAGSCHVREHVKGKTRKITTKAFGELIVDLEKFAELSGLPMNNCLGTLEYSVFLREVTDKNFGDKKIMLVLVKGTFALSNDDGGSPTALQSMMARLEARAKSGLEPALSFHACELDSGWQLYNNALFEDLLGWWKRGYDYHVTADENRGVRISY